MNVQNDQRDERISWQTFLRCALAWALLFSAVELRGQLGVPVTPPAPLNNNAGSDSGDDRYPLVLTDGGGTWLAVWHSNDDLDGTIGSDWDILLARSTDNGATWSDPAPLNNNAGSDSGDDRYPLVRTDGRGTWLAVWTSDLSGTIGTDRDLLMARSTDNGATWTNPTPLNSTDGPDGGSVWGMRMATDGSGTWLVAWASRDDLGGTIGTDADILLTRSTDNGVTWTDPTPLNSNAGSDSGRDGGLQMVSDGGGTWLVAWTSNDDLRGTIGTDRDILVARSIDNGATWTDITPATKH